MTSLYDWTPIIAYSVISGLLATNANLTLQFVRRKEDIKNGMTSLLAARGASMVRHLYLLNVVLACCIMLLPFGAVGFGNGWFTILVVLFVFASGIFVYTMMKKDAMADAMKIRNLVIWQYVAVIVLLLCMVFFSNDSYWLTFFARH